MDHRGSSATLRGESSFDRIPYGTIYREHDRYRDRSDKLDCLECTCHWRSLRENPESVSRSSPAYNREAVPWGLLEQVEQMPVRGHKATDKEHLLHRYHTERFEQ